MNTADHHRIGLAVAIQGEVIIAAPVCCCRWHGGRHFYLIGEHTMPAPPPAPTAPEDQLWLSMTDATDGRIGVLVHIGQRRYIRATWGGGAYVELQFLPLPKPTEVLNVWDDEKGRPVIEWPRGADGQPLARVDGLTPTHEALARRILAWAQDQPDPDWWAAYQRNGKYDR